VKGHDNVWGIGDCSVNPDAGGKGYPATAQAAIREGAGVALNLARAVRGQSTYPIDIVNQGALAAFGRFDAVAKIFNFKFTGFVAWFLWRTVYLLKMPGLGRKVRVAADWTLALLTRREFAEMGIHKLVRASSAAGAPAPAAATAEQAPRREEPAAAGVT
jgi:NADH dehydrogenase